MSLNTTSNNTSNNTESLNTTSSNNISSNTLTSNPQSLNTTSSNNSISNTISPDAIPSEQISPEDIIRLKNIEKLIRVFINNFIVPRHIDVKHNNAQKTIKGYIDQKFVLYIDVPNNVLIFSPHIQQILVKYNLGKHILIISETADDNEHKNKLLSDLSQCVDAEQSLSFVVYRNGEFLL